MFACLADPWLATALHPLPLYWQLYLSINCFASNCALAVSSRLLFCSAASYFIPPTASIFFFFSGLFFSRMRPWQFSFTSFFSANANPPSFFPSTELALPPLVHANLPFSVLALCCRTLPTISR
ncbi:hypothetical protein J3F84DRAFT_28973 [Trichoderma pleuroticola]